MSPAQLTGADVGALRDLAAKMEGAAAQLDTVRAQVRSRLHASPWQGRDADSFRTAWDGSHTRQLQQTCEGLRRMAGELHRNADEQEEASSAGGASSGRGGPTGSPSSDGGDGSSDLSRLLKNLAKATGITLDWLDHRTPDGLTGILKHAGRALTAFDVLEDVKRMAHGAWTLDPLEFVHGQVGLSLAVLSRFPVTAPVGIAGSVVWAAANDAYEHDPRFRALVDKGLRPVDDFLDGALEPSRQAWESAQRKAGDVIGDAAREAWRRAEDGDWGPGGLPFGPVPVPVNPLIDGARVLGGGAVQLGANAVEAGANAVGNVADAVSAGADAVSDSADAIGDSAGRVAANAAGDVVRTMTNPLWALAAR